MAYETKVLVDGLAFGEGPRWHEGKLWFSDMHDHKVMTVDLNGKTETVVEVPALPSGLGWLPDGRLLIVSITDRRLLRLDPDGLSVAADLGKLALACNDMVVDNQGRAYIGSYEYTLQTYKPGAPAWIILVTPDGDVRVVADEIDGPNGTVITPDGHTLIVAESFAAQLTAFDIEPDGSLTGRRAWAQVEGAMPDGICLDAEGAIWVAPSNSAEVLRVLEGGEVTHRIRVSTTAFACMLGGPERGTLFIMTADTFNPEEARAKRSGRIETVKVDVPGAGLP